MMTDTLIARLESAGEGSRELSDECLLAVGWEREVGATTNPDIVFWRLAGNPHWGHWRSVVTEYPDPSQNVQDAIDWMVPEGAHVSAQFDTPEPGSDTAASMVISYGEERLGGGLASTPALALCIASLKARESTDG